MYCVFVGVVFKVFIKLLDYCKKKTQNYIEL